MKKRVFVIVLMAAALGLAACETVKGLGADISHTSERVQRNLP